MSKLWTTPVAVQYKVNFYSGGDTTRDAFSKHIQELERIYGLLNALDTAKVSASAVSSLTSTISSLNSRINNLDNKIDDKVNDLDQKIGDVDLDAINDRIDDLEDEVEKNKPKTLKYRIMETMFSPAQKGSSYDIIQDTWTKGTDSKLSYATFEGEENYRVFTVPNGVYKLVIDACGGGGGASGSTGGTVFRLVRGRNAASVKNLIYNVTPGDKLYIYSGRGGKGCSEGRFTGTCSDGEDTEVKYGNSSSTAATASRIILCQGGYSATTMTSNPTGQLPITNGYSSGGTLYPQETGQLLYPSSPDFYALLAGISNESTLIPPYGAGGAFNTSWSRSNNYTGTYGVVVIRYVGIY